MLQRMRKLSITASLAWLCCHLAHASCLGDPNASKVHAFDVVPQFTAAKIYTTWSPLLQRVGQETGMCFDLRVSTSIPEFEQKILKGEGHAFNNPSLLILVEDVYLALAKKRLVVTVTGAKPQSRLQDCHSQ